METTGCNIKVSVDRLRLRGAYLRKGPHIEGLNFWEETYHKTSPNFAGPWQGPHTFGMLSVQGFSSLKSDMGVSQS